MKAKTVAALALLILASVLITSTPSEAQYRRGGVVVVPSVTLRIGPAYPYPAYPYPAYTYPAYPYPAYSYPAYPYPSYVPPAAYYPYPYYSYTPRPWWQSP